MSRQNAAHCWHLISVFNRTIKIKLDRYTSLSLYLSVHHEVRTLLPSGWPITSILQASHLLWIFGLPELRVVVPGVYLFLHFWIVPFWGTTYLVSNSISLLGDKSIYCIELSNLVLVYLWIMLTADFSAISNTGTKSINLWNWFLVLSKNLVKIIIVLT